MSKRTILAICFTVILFSCEKDDNDLHDKLVGTWVSEVNNLVMEEPEEISIQSTLELYDNNTFKNTSKLLSWTIADSLQLGDNSNMQWNTYSSYSTIVYPGDYTLIPPTGEWKTIGSDILEMKHTVIDELMETDTLADAYTNNVIYQWHISKLTADSLVLVQKVEPHVSFMNIVTYVRK